MIDLRLSDHYADLASEGIDLAFRIGRSDMLSLKTRKLGEFHSVVVASPDYIAKHGAPETPEDLQQHSCILDTNRRMPTRWMLRKGKNEIVANVDGRFRVNSARASVELAIAGLGIAYAPKFALCDALESGALVQVIEGYRGETGPVSAVYLEGRALPRKVRALIDFALIDIRTVDIL